MGVPVNKSVFREGREGSLCRFQSIVEYSSETVDKQGKEEKRLQVMFYCVESLTMWEGPKEQKFKRSQHIRVVM